MVARAHPSPALFAALADETRLSLIDRLLVERACSTTRLAEGTDLTRQAVRKHLGVLADAGLVRDRRVGRERLWELHAAPLADASGWLDTVRRQWEARLDRLDAFLVATHASET
ncbi:MAG: winged helix-turn-helix transcriptional regulator [Alphaproteobacteria bacterium]|nr:winged helix-turn-helix transcriptional regulator [Alphaproteobacteria bacterium]